MKFLPRSSALGINYYFTLSNVLCCLCLLGYYYGKSRVTIDAPIKEVFNKTVVIEMSPDESERIDQLNKTVENKSERIDQLMKWKHKSLQLTSKKDCFCPDGRKNWIYYTNCPGRGGEINQGAGIKDRQNILRHMFWYADELCANVALLCTPNEWLSELHGCFAPKKAEWNEYFTPLRMSEKGTISTVDFFHWNVDVSKTIEGLTRIEGRPSIEKYELGRKLYSEGIPFVWVFNTNFWSTDLYTPKHNWPNQELSHQPYSDTCGIIDFDTSEELLDIGHLAMQELNLAYSDDFVTLHLRRGDYKKCETKPEAVMKYLNCSMDGDNVRNVVVLTNGKQRYLDFLKTHFSKTFPDKNLIILDEVMKSVSFLQKLDRKNITRTHVGEKFLNDNCYFFSTEKVLVSMAKYHLERGHISCEPCDKRGVGVNELGKNIIR